MESQQITEHTSQIQQQQLRNDQSDTPNQNITHNPQKTHQQSYDVIQPSSKKQQKRHQHTVKDKQEDPHNNYERKDNDVNIQSSSKKKQLNFSAYTPKEKQKSPKHQINNSDQQEAESKGYQDLTKKLQTALNKISSAKKGLSQTSSQTNTIWRRAEQCAQKKKKDLQRKRQQSQQMKSKQIRAKPTINKNSERLAKEVGYEPIYNRYEKLLEAKQKKNKQIQEIKKKQKQEEQANYMEELNRHMRRPQTIRTYEDYFEQMVKWKERTTKQNRQKLQQQKSKQLEGVTFKPVLNPKSKKMVSSQSRLPIDQRGLVKGQTKTEYPFRPSLTRGVGK